MAKRAPKRLVVIDVFIQSAVGWVFACLKLFEFNFASALTFCFKSQFKSLALEYGSRSGS